MRFVQNLRYAWRLLLRNRGLNAIILLTLALGIGANTAIFTVDYATLFAPLSYPQPEQLVTVWSRTNANRLNPSPQTFVEWRKLSRSLQELSAFTGGTFGISNIDQPESVWGMRVTANYFRTLGSPFFLERDFLPGEDQEGKNHVVIFTHKLWSHLGADPKFVGHTMRIDGKPYTVIGVLQPGIADRDIFEMAMPLVFTPEELQNSSVDLVAIGRLKNGISIQQAQDDVGAIMAHLAPRVPVKSTAGAGDALLAGVIAAITLGIPFIAPIPMPSKVEKSVATALEFGVLLASYTVTSPHSIHPDASFEAIGQFARDSGISISPSLKRSFTTRRASADNFHGGEVRQP